MKAVKWAFICTLIRRVETLNEEQFVEKVEKNLPNEASPPSVRHDSRVFDALYTVRSKLVVFV